jgi:hypothetical protein
MGNYFTSPISSTGAVVTVANASIIASRNIAIASDETKRQKRKRKENERKKEDSGNTIYL